MQFVPTLILAAILCACGGSPSRPVAAPTTPEPTESVASPAPEATPACKAPRLYPTYIPKGFTEVSVGDHGNAGDEWHSWRQGPNQQIEIVNGFHADLGWDEHPLKIRVRGYKALASDQEGFVLWGEPIPCVDPLSGQRTATHVVMGSGVQLDQLIRVAKSLRDKPQTS